MSRLELYTPWREPSASLRQRNVGRADLERRVLQAADELVRGGSPLPLFLFGPRGVGKSHLIALVRDELQRLGCAVRYLPEDIPAVRSADELLQRVRRSDDLAGWRSWGDPAREPEPAEGPVVIVVEALDRRLTELGAGRRGHEERQRLRAAWSASATWVIGTGVELGPVLTDPSEPFFGWFDAEPIEPLTPDEAALLLDRCVDPQTSASTDWRGRRAVLLALAGGSPRVLVTLAETCGPASSPEAASNAVLDAVDRFTAHYQLRFRDLPTGAQHIVEVLANAPRELTPNELAGRVGASQQSVGTQCRRLAGDGVLLRREEPAGTWYSIAEPLFRFWLEYRTAPWSATRVAFAAALLAALFAPDAIADRWWRGPPDDVVRGALGHPRVANAAARRIEAAMRSASESGDLSALGEGLERAARDGVSTRELCEAHLYSLSARREWDAMAVMHEHLAPGLVRDAVDAAVRIHRGEPPAAVFRRWIRSEPDAEEDYRVAWCVMDRALEATARAGAPWKLAPADQRRLARLPVVRAAMLGRGRLESHPAVLEPHHLIGRLRKDDPDLGELLAESMRLGDPALVEHVLVVGADSGFIGHELPRNPRPALPVPILADLVARWILRHGNPTFSSWVTWSRSLAEVDAVILEEVVTWLRSARRSVDAEPLDMLDAELALVALGVASPGVLRELSDVAPDAWRDSFTRALDLAHQLAEPSAGRLHAELERLRDAIAPA